MKLVADIDKIKSNLTSLSSSVDEFSSAVNSYNGASIDCSIEEINGILNDYKNGIGEELSKLDTSSNEYKELVNECCNEYKSNEEKIQNIDIDYIKDVIMNNRDVTVDYKGNAANALTGLPSVELTSAGTGQVKLIDGSVVDTSDYVELGQKYNLSDEDLAYLAHVAIREQGSLGGAKMELSLMANLYEKNKNNYSSVVDYVKHSGWFASRSLSDYSYPGDDYFNAAKEVLNEGHLYVPSNVIEHDYMGDISSISTGSVNNRSDYIPGKTVIHNTMGATYTFIGFAPNNGDPFGYKEA